jgi:hypothetical protein
MMDINKNIPERVDIYGFVPLLQKEKEEYLF